jgi:hypothetical protein
MRTLPLVAGNFHGNMIEESGIALLVPEVGVLGLGI